MQDIWNTIKRPNFTGIEEGEAMHSKGTGNIQ
jgi:hypothetical protein